MPAVGGPHGERPEALIVGLEQSGDTNAFAELVRRRQSWIRNLMRRFSGDAVLADDLSQQVFLQAWPVAAAEPFWPWMKQLAVNVWLQHLRKTDALNAAGEIDESAPGGSVSTGVTIDLDRVLAALAEPVRLCIVLAYHEGMTHGEIAELTNLPPGTVKSHIRRGTQRLQQLLAHYATESKELS